MKYKIIKAIDVAGLNFLAPVVLLCYGEEPRKQLKEIGRFIVVPALAFLAFIVLWFVVAKNVQTKSGQLPNPSETWKSASSIWTFHAREQDKAEAYTLSGKSREQRLEAVEARLAKLERVEPLVNEKVQEVKRRAAEATEARVAPIMARYATMKEAYDAAQRRRQLALERMAAGDTAAKQQHLAQVRLHKQKTEQEKTELKELKAEADAIRAEKSPEVAAALRVQTQIAEERQYLGKMSDLLTRANRSQKTDAQKEKLKEQQLAFLAAKGADAYQAALRVAKQEDRIKDTAGSGYAMPATLPFQIKRSVLCVFTGFFIGSAIAIPIGILCGLSKTFMAAMTPFIALFKPVSPIVWLPVALIVVGGFIPDPDKHWFTQWLWGLPWLGQYKINPAFIASAITVALCSLWATMVNTAFGVASVDEDHINVARVLRLGFWDRLFKIVLPSALPLVFAGLRISLGVGWMVLIAAELLSSSEGIGKFVWDQFNNGASDSFAKMMVVVFVVGVIGLLLDRIMIVFQRLVSFDGAPTAI